jgi:hypothetical protein
MVYTAKLVCPRCGDEVLITGDLSDVSEALGKRCSKCTKGHYVLAKKN